VSNKIRWILGKYKVLAANLYASGIWYYYSFHTDKKGERRDFCAYLARQVIDKNPLLTMARNIEMVEDTIWEQIFMPPLAFNEMLIEEVRKLDPVIASKLIPSE